ncbi:MAG: manganese-dependent inorganic pyrophosphatase [Anaerolineae bacterium]|nr:manganese-dependent inorganic pyrophosphatase [Anaerolineae bacterium]
MINQEQPLDQVQRIVEAVNGCTPLLIMPHNDPDPDAVAGSLGLQYLLAQTIGVESVIGFNGIIGRAENKALLDYLGRPLTPMTHLDQHEFMAVALVDTQPGAGNNMLPPHAQVAVVIDHHPWREATAEARFADVRIEAGSTAAILTEYLRAAELPVPRQLATALFYGIKTDTMGLTRQASPLDADAYLFLQPLIDTDALIEIERAQVPLDYFKSLDAALRATKIYDRVAVSYIGVMTYPDLAAELADTLLRLEGVDWVICTGVFEDKLILSVRTRSRQGGAGRLAQAVVGQQGTAGGHGAMAGGQIVLNGGDPRVLAHQLSRRALRHLSIPLKTTSKRLI